MNTENSSLLGLYKTILSSNEYVSDLADFYFVFSDATRMRILLCLAIEDKCVGDIVKELRIQQSTVSHQLQILRRLRFVKLIKKGRSVIYSLASNRIYEAVNYGVRILFR